MARVASDRVQLYCERGGSGSRTLVLLHGLGANGDAWDGMKPILRDRWQGRWIIPDLRGHGRSPRGAPYSYGGHAADVAALLEQDEEIVILGHSMGGVVALALATGWFGVQVQRVAAFGIKIKWATDEETKLRQLAGAPARWFETQAEAVDRYLKVSGLIGLVGPTDPGALSGVVKEDGRFRLASDPMINAVVGPRVEEFVAAARAPFRLAAGETDLMVSFADMLPFDSDPDVFPGAGHNAHVEQPENVWSFLMRED